MSEAVFRETFGSGKLTFHLLIDQGGWTVSSSDGTVVGKGQSSMSEFEQAMSEVDSFVTAELVPLLEQAAVVSATKIGRIDARFFEQQWEQQVTEKP